MVIEKPVKLLEEEHSTISDALKFKTIEIRPGKGIAIKASSQGVNLSKELAFGDTLMSVLQSLGNPSKEFYEGEKHFLHYLELGLDVIFEPQKNQVKKMVLHLNDPKMSDFGFYERIDCNLLLTKKTV